MSHGAGARVARITASAVVAALALSVVLVAPAVAAATATRFTDAVTSPPEDIVDDCTGLAGTVAGVGVVTGTVVETAQGFHLQTASNFVLTFEFVDGSSGTGTLVEHQSFNTGRGATVFTNAHLDTLTLFAPDGSLLVDASFRLVEHFTIGRDGSVRASFEIGHFRGDC